MVMTIPKYRGDDTKPGIASATQLTASPGFGEAQKDVFDFHVHQPFMGHVARWKRYANNQRDIVEKLF